jgi:hypothetical protein
LSYLQDAQAHPDGGFPALTTGLPPAAPALAWRQSLQANDLRNWTPTAPVQLCGGDLDPIVFFFNTQLIENYWASRASATINVVDLESTASNDTYGNLKQGFAVAKALVEADAIAQGASDGGAFAVAEAYHAELVAPFCFGAAKQFFDAH